MAAAVAALSIVVAAVVSGSGGAAAEAGAPAAAPALVGRLPFALSNSAAADGEEGQQGGWLEADCWGAVDGLRSRCADEAAVFFLDGEAYLGRGCCLAVRAVARRCGWPARALAAAVGVTADEAGVLRGFCDDGPSPAAHP